MHVVTDVRGDRGVGGELAGRQGCREGAEGRVIHPAAGAVPGTVVVHRGVVLGGVRTLRDEAAAVRHRLDEAALGAPGVADLTEEIVYGEGMGAWVGVVGHPLGGPGGGRQVVRQRRRSHRRPVRVGAALVRQGRDVRRRRTADHRAPIVVLHPDPHHVLVMSRRRCGRPARPAGRRRRRARGCGRWLGGCALSGRLGRCGGVVRSWVRGGQWGSAGRQHETGAHQDHLP